MKDIIHCKELREIQITIWNVTVVQISESDESYRRAAFALF
jgi:hypothetical protein